MFRFVNARSSRNARFFIHRFYSFPLAEHWSSYYCELICLRNKHWLLLQSNLSTSISKIWSWLFTHLWRLDKQDSRLKISLSWHFTSSLKLLSNWTFLSEHVDRVVFALNRFVNCVDRVVFASNRVVGSRRKSRRWIASFDRVVSRVERVAISALQFLACCSASFCPIGTIFTILELAA